MKRRLRIAIVGTQEYPGRPHVEAFVELLPPRCLVVVDGQPGVGEWASEAARGRGLFVVSVLLDHRPRASRRVEYAEALAELADVVYAFWDPAAADSKTLIRQARALDRRVTVLGPDGEPIEGFEA